MSDWTGGYVADIGYTFGYYTELNPERLRLPFLSKKLAVPEIKTACELGFGQGISVNMHAAASATQWHGTDFNPSQANFAQQLGRISDSSAQLSDESFEQFCARDDLPDFDFIGLHGIWSWISDANRAVIVDFLKRKLKVGGVLYISYNTQPGWAAMAPMRELLTEHSSVMGAPGQGVVGRVNEALDFADRLIATNPLFIKANPMVPQRLTHMREQNRNYLAHEYFNRDWHPMGFSKMAEWMSQAKLNFACSADPLQHLESIHVTPEQQALLKEINDVQFRESVRDFCINQQFRRDYWVKGSLPLGNLAQRDQLRRQAVILIKPRADVELTVTGALGKATMQEAVYGPLLDALADHRPRTLGELELMVATMKINMAQITEAMLVLNAIGVTAAVQQPTVIANAAAQTIRLNRHILETARDTADLSYLASPVTGGAIPVDRIQQLFLLAREDGLTMPEQWATRAWECLELQGQRLIHEGKAVEGRDANLTLLYQRASAFRTRLLPILVHLQIAPP